MTGPENSDAGTPDRQIDQVVELLRDCRNLFFITGAGVSADSGLPTYRGIGGLYDAKTTEDSLAIEELLSGDMLSQRPELTWKYLLQIENAARDATFNRAHEVIAEMESQFNRVCTLTQNVDGFHRAAGSSNVIDIHGDLHFLYCTVCEYETTVADYSGLTLPPSCPECGALVRPDVVLFGEMLSPEKLQRLQDEAARGVDIVFSVGTTSSFSYIAEPVVLARKYGIPTVEINPGTSEVSGIVDFKIAMKSAAALDQIWCKLGF